MARVRALESDGASRALSAKIEEIRAHLARITPRDSTERYRIGLAVRALEEDPRKYGQAAVARTARALGVGEGTLYEYALVARAWSERAFQDLAARKGGRTGLPLSFSHFIELAAIEDTEARNAVVEEALARGWTVRELRVRIGAAGSDTSDAAYPFLQSIVNTSKSLRERREAWRESFARLADAEPSRELAALLESTLAAQRELENDFAEDAALTEAALKRVRGALSRS
jgi:hypothetical protein